MKLLAIIVVSIFATGAALGQPREFNGHFRRARAEQTTDQVIVKWRSGSAMAAASSRHRAQQLRSMLPATRDGRQLTEEMDILKLDRAYRHSELQPLLAQLAASPEVEYALADQRRWAHAVPSDPLYAGQWYFQATEAAASRAEQAWDTTVGSRSTIVAVLDTGVRFEHPDLGPAGAEGKMLPGFDFIADSRIANDGDGIDSDPSDPGDWITAAQALEPPFSIDSCIPDGADHLDSSWHGTRVSSLIAALTNNTGMAGAGWNTLILPVRVLGRCGGNDSDIIAAMRWAAGLTVVGVPANPNPANIINLSLGGTGPCSPAYQQTIDAMTARGVLIVASAGNEGGAIGSPANCTGVLAVTGLRHAGTKVGFSNLGPQADLGAPAGNCVNIDPGAPCLFSILAATDTGTTVPQSSTYTDAFNFNVGTSFSAPLVTGTAALMHSLNTRLSPANYISLLRETATPFPTSSTTTTTVCRAPGGEVQAEECICTVQTCGAGMLNAHAAVLAAQRPYAIAVAPLSIAPMVNIRIDGSSSFAADRRTITSYQWSAVSVSGAAPVFADASAAQTTLHVPGTSRFTLQLTVTDDQGAQDSAHVQVATSSPIQTTPTPPATNGGGGSMGVLTLALGLLRLRRAAPWRSSYGSRGRPALHAPVSAYFTSPSRFASPIRYSLNLPPRASCFKPNSTVACK